MQLISLHSKKRMPQKNKTKKSNPVFWTEIQSKSEEKKSPPEEARKS
jgi:hypothetical protein